VTPKTCIFRGFGVAVNHHGVAASTIGTLPMGPDGQPLSAYLLYITSRLTTAVTVSHYLCGTEDVQSGETGNWPPSQTFHKVV